MGRASMTVRRGGVLLALAMLVILAAGLWYRYGQPRRIVSVGSVDVVGLTSAGAVTLRTRVVMIGATRFDEVELPGGTWIDCAGECARAAREAGPEFWRRLERSGGR